MIIDNPASRLSRILSEGLTISNEYPCRRAWEQVLSIKANDNSALFSLLGQVMLLPNEVAQLVSRHFPHQVSSISLWKDPVDTALLHQNIQGQWQTFRQHINPYCIPQLNLISDLLHTKIRTTEVDSQDIESQINSFCALLDEISSSSLSADLKLYLISELSALLLLLRQYRVTGAEPILRQADSMIGHIVRNQDYRTFLKNEDLGNRLLENLTAMANLMAVATGLPQLTVVIAGLLN